MLNNILAVEFIQSGILSTIKYQFKDIYMNLLSVEQNTTIDKDELHEFLERYKELEKEFNGLISSRGKQLNDLNN